MPITITTNTSFRVYNPEHHITNRSGNELPSGTHEVESVESPGIQKGEWYMLSDGFGAPKKVWEWATDNNPTHDNYPSTEKV